MFPPTLLDDCRQAKKPRHGQALIKAAQFYEKLWIGKRSLTSLIEPLLIGFMAAIVGSINVGDLHADLRSG
jgi:type II secretory pathway component PulF